MTERERIGNTSELPEQERVDIIERSSRRLGRSVFFSVLIMIVSFSPILFLSGQAQKLFSPLVLTKTFSMIGAAILAITVTPMLTRALAKGRLVPESRNPVSGFFVRIYSPVIRVCLRWKKTVVLICLLVIGGSIPLVLHLGTEFMPPLDEGSLLMMPVTLPDVSNTEAKRILQLQDKLLTTVPEVENVLGKSGRAYTATDNAPISMIETIILLKPKSEWREGLTTQMLIDELNEKVRIPGVVVGWTQPIINRINMLSTGIRTDVGVKVYGQDLDTIYAISRKIEGVLKNVNGLTDLYTEQLTGGKYLNITIRREELGRYGLNIEDVNMMIESALGGMNLTGIVNGRERFSLCLRLGQDFRSTYAAIGRIPVQTAQYGIIPLSAVVDIAPAEGPPMISSENAMLRGTVLFNVRGRDMGSVVNEAKQKVDSLFAQLPKGYSIDWSGQYENQVEAQNRLRIIIPIVILIIGFILYFTFRSAKEVLVVFISIPVALMGGVYSLYYYHVNFSVAVAVGFIALFGVAVETGVIMIEYMNIAIGDLVERKRKQNENISAEEIKQAIHQGATPRVRPILMTNLANIIGLIPVLASTGVGSDVMKPVTIPFVFGLISAILFVLIVLPVIYLIMKEWELKRKGHLSVLNIKED